MDKQSNTVQPFQIQIPQATLDDLKERLADTRWIAPVKGVGWDYGTDVGYIRELAEYWRTKYDWRKHEAELNKFKHFKTNIDGVGIHFIHERGKGPNPKPLLLTHGWPDSFYRFHKVIPMLTDPGNDGGNAADSFDVIVPSLPGFGFSDRKAMSDEQVADLWVKLMQENLGYEKFFAAGGDVGSNVSKALAYKYPQAVTAMHLTDVGYPMGQEDFASFSEAEQKFAAFIQSWWMKEGGFNMIQSTKPQTLAYALNDSPAGLAAWIMNFGTTGSDAEKLIPRDELLTNITLYWVTETIASSIRAYYAGAHAEPLIPPGTRLTVPTAVAHAELDAPLPRDWADRNVNLVHFSEFSGVGHFAAWEKPDAFVQDVREAFRPYRAG